MLNFMSSSYLRIVGINNPIAQASQDCHNGIRACGLWGCESRARRLGVQITLIMSPTGNDRRPVGRREIVSESFINRYSSSPASAMSPRARECSSRLYYRECRRRCATGKKGRVFIRRDEMHSSRAGREKSRRARSLTQWLDGLARWFMQSERKMGVASLSIQLRKIRSVPLCDRVFLSRSLLAS